MTRAGKCSQDERAMLIEINPVPDGSSVTTNFTYENYLKTSDDESYKLLDGELFILPAPNTAHQYVTMKLGARYDMFIEERRLGVGDSAPTDVLLSESDVGQLNLMFISSEQDGMVTSANVTGAPDLLVEIGSDANAERDEILRRNLYAEHGVKEYWMVDPDARTITVLILGRDDNGEVTPHRNGQSLNSRLLEGFSVNLDEVFRCHPGLGEAEEYLICQAPCKSKA
ncbi:MAG: Uma2 family endonuclease [Caldilineaceae bacterium SB0670_bin_27]|uniref:Uma2 family endonuclease n=1 Tax=Caldilineaceae bacterium SB0664_bin_27 TaxID=2605260 RepID=A0A6B0YXD7_9CHLR|nr:Uma2 family endonuclease [Caldilineaceae bacterium SB0664_bin_27]MYJ76890.1 Uma2 family endonuclease [Caldilineaceae bacterium SB0670_bin_27]